MQLAFSETNMEKARKKEKENKISISGEMLLSVALSRPWGHLTSLFINLLAQWKDSCLAHTLLTPTPVSSLSHFLFFTLPPSLSFTAFFLQHEPLLTLMKRHVLHDFLLQTNIRDVGEI